MDINAFMQVRSLCDFHLVEGLVDQSSGSLFGLVEPGPLTVVVMVLKE